VRQATLSHQANRGGQILRDHSLINTDGCTMFHLEPYEIGGIIALQSGFTANNALLSAADFQRHNVKISSFMASGFS
jgi:hypothetical protein